VEPSWRLRSSLAWNATSKAVRRLACVRLLVLAPLLLALVGCGSKPWHETGTFSVRGTCVAAASPDETESRMICRHGGGALECWNNSPRRFMYAKFDDACKAARSAVEKAGKLP
jgi:hypothetical protein